MDSATVLAGNGAIYLNQHLSLVFIYLLPLVVSSCDYYFTGPRDIVIMFDASASVQKEDKKEIRICLENFLKNQVVLRPEFAHLSVIEFYSKHEVLLDGISNKTQFQYECETLGDHWFQLYEHDKSKQSHDGFPTGLKNVTEILGKGRKLRPDVKQDLLIFSDAEDLYIDKLVIDGNMSDLMNAAVNVYGIGVGGHLDSTSFVDILQNNTACYEPLEAWKKRTMNMSKEKQTVIKNALENDDDDNDVDGDDAYARSQSRLTVNQSLCDSCSADHQCYCRNEFLPASKFVCLKGNEATTSTPTPESSTKGFSSTWGNEATTSTPTPESSTKGFSSMSGMQGV